MLLADSDCLPASMGRKISPPLALQHVYKWVLLSHLNVFKCDVVSQTRKVRKYKVEILTGDADSLTSSSLIEPDCHMTAQWQRTSTSSGSEQPFPL